MPKFEGKLFSIDNIYDLRCVINEKSRPTSMMTNKIWQDIFEQLREKTIPLANGSTRLMKVGSSHFKTDEYGNCIEDDSSDWRRYCLFINDTLHDLRKGKKSICFYYYQIQELLEFHTSDLESKFDDKNKYWEVWLKDAKK